MAARPEAGPLALFLVDQGGPGYLVLPFPSVERLLQGVLRLLGEEPKMTNNLKGEARIEATVKMVLTPIDERIRRILSREGRSLFAWPVALPLLPGHEQSTNSNRRNKPGAAGAGTSASTNDKISSLSTRQRR